MAKDQVIPKAAFIITLADLFVALLAGAVIFPIVFTYGLSPTVGAELAFTTLPIAFSLMPAGQFFAIAVFWRALLCRAYVSWFLAGSLCCGSGQSLGMDKEKEYRSPHRIPGALLITIGAHLISGIDVPGTSFIPGTHPVGTLFQVEGVALVAPLILIVGIVAGKIRK